MRPQYLITVRENQAETVEVEAIEVEVVIETRTEEDPVEATETHGTGAKIRENGTEALEIDVVVNEVEKKVGVEKEEVLHRVTTEAVGADFIRTWRMSVLIFLHSNKIL